jgi:hypothetical protein
LGGSWRDRWRDRCGGWLAGWWRGRQATPLTAAVTPPPPRLYMQATVDTPSQPPLELRVSTAKLLMEVGRPDDALELLQAPY